MVCLCVFYGINRYNHLAAVHTAFYLYIFRCAYSWPWLPCFCCFKACSQNKGNVIPCYHGNIGGGCFQQLLHCLSCCILFSYFYAIAVGGWTEGCTKLFYCSSQLI